MQNTISKNSLKNKIFNANACIFKTCVQFQKFLPAVSFINCKEKRNQVQLSSTSFILFWHSDV